MECAIGDRGVGKRNAFQVWQGPALILGRDQHGRWLIFNGTPILCSPRLMRSSTLNEIQGRGHE